MERGTEPVPGGAASSSKSSQPAASRKQSADSVHAERDTTASIPVVCALDPPPKRPSVPPRGGPTEVDVPAASNAHARTRASIETASEDHALVASSLRRTSSAATAASAAGADAMQPPTVPPAAAEAHLSSTRSKTTTLGRDADVVPPPVRRSSRSKKRRRKSSSKSSSTSSERGPTESMTTTGSGRQPSGASPTAGFTLPLEASVIADFAPVINDFAAEIVALYGGNDATAGTSVDTVSAGHQRKSSSVLAPDDSAGPADKAAAGAPKNGDDTAAVAPSSSHDQRVVHPGVQADAGAVILDDRDAAVGPLDQKQADAVGPTTYAQEDQIVLPWSATEDKDTDTAGQDKLAAHSGAPLIAVPKKEPDQEGPPAVSAAATAPLFTRQPLVHGQASDGAPKRGKGAAQNKEAEGSRSMSKGSDDRAVSSHGVRRSVVGSPSQWSFYPLNVTFLTEMDTYQERLLYGAVICSIAVVCSMLLGAVIALMFGSEATSPLACVTPQCVAARDYLTGLLNTSRDACNDFYGYVCSSWIVQGRDGGSFRADSIAATLVKINNHLWRRQDADDDPTELRLMRRVYQKCHSYAGDSRIARSFSETLEFARKPLNWAPIRRSRAYRDLVALLVRTSLLLGFHTVVAIQLLAEDGRVLVRLSCGQSLLRKLTTTGDRRDLEAALRAAYHDAGELSRILAVDRSAGGHLERCEEGSAGRRDVTGTLDEILDDLVPGVNATEWVSAVDEVLADSGHNGSHIFDYGLASGAPAFRLAFHEVAASVDGGVETAAMYLASHLDAEILSVELSRNRLLLDPADRAEFCLALARKPVSISWPRLLARMLGLRGSREALVTMFEYLKESASRSTVFTWLAKAVPRVAEKSIQKVELALVSEDMTPKSARTARVTDTAPLDADFEQRNASFVEIFVQAMAFVHRRLAQSPPTRQEFIVSRLEQLGELDYSEATSSVVVPTLYQREPHFYPADVPPYFNYATVGALMATRIAEVVEPALETAKETEGPSRPLHDVWRSRLAKRQYNNTAQCLERLHRRLGLRHRAEGGTTAALKRRDMVLRVQGLRLAYDALVESFGVATAGSEFRRLWPEAQAVFFARFCLLSCGTDQKGPKPGLSPRANCLLPLHNMPEFGTVFDCGSREDFVAEQCLP
ncbi:uncharacterized protein [Dermacentor albipictus]|uniref:uncharacterized protein n=1 Tax=Dermacentor albipictus TaxID=60249 RepID=UPI0038FCC51B